MSLDHQNVTEMATSMRVIPLALPRLAEGASLPGVAMLTRTVHERARLRSEGRPQTAPASTAADPPPAGLTRQLRNRAGELVRMQRPPGQRRSRASGPAFCRPCTRQVHQRRPARRDPRCDSNDDWRNLLRSTSAVAKATHGRLSRDKR
jgi:hypothetical protein